MGEVSPVEEEMPQISLHALDGMHTYQTMGVTDKTKNTTLHILIYSGSTHNFLDISVAKGPHYVTRRIDINSIVILGASIFLANNFQLMCY